MWVGLRASGVIRLHPRRFYLRQIKDGLLDDDTSSLCADNQGRLWVAGRRQMLVRATDATNRSFTQPEGWPDWVKAIMAVYPDPSGGVWFGTNAGLLRYSGEWSFIRESLHDQVTALLADRTGVVWAATINGPLVRHQAGQDLRLPETNGLTHVVALAEDHAGRIWAGTENGLVFQKSGDHFLPVPLPGAKPGDFVQFIVPDGPNTVWIGAARGGLYRWRDGRVDRLPDGLDTEVHERGDSLSSGERQLVALARAFLAQPRVLVLDEATANLDLQSEAAIEAGLETLLDNRTAILIAHRLSTAMKSDRIVVVEDGQIVEAGPHDELVSAGGRYAAMFEAWMSHIGEAAA